MVDGGQRSLTVWNPNRTYAKGDLVVMFKDRRDKSSALEDGKQENVFLLMSLKDVNSSTPNYEMVNGLPDFTVTGWKLLNPTSYLLQNLNEMRMVVEKVFKNLILEHERIEHGLAGSSNIESNLIKTDYSTLQTSWRLDDFTLT